ncbi:erythrocyte vesicle protein 1, putative (EVP1) [Plasmodium malariae]|uniref:Erythrocyte vesicle protein 1, putative (EVP1) n=1 Tax=Plasmodium malariae TaxID=5858 RepID=A0A1A8WIE3_PLAMA|nr:erythrocyte vesicle protein 1, putative (EVP1) [Plasmodium malariae]
MTIKKKIRFDNKVEKKQENRDSSNDEYYKNCNLCLGIIKFYNALGGKDYKLKSDAKIKMNNSRAYTKTNKKKDNNKEKFHIINTTSHDYDKKSYKKHYIRTITSGKNLVYYKNNDKHCACNCKEKKEILKSKGTLSKASSCASISSISDSSNMDYNKTDYDKVSSHLFGLSTLFYKEKIDIVNMSKKLTKDYLKCFKELSKSISDICENNFTHSYEEFIEIDNKMNPLNENKIEKYYYAYHRIVYTFLFFLHEILQKQDALQLSFESLPLYLQLDKQGLVENIMQTEPIINNLNEKNYKSTNNNATAERKKINEYLKQIHGDIKDYIKDLNEYLKLFFDYGNKEKLFNEPALFSYSLFFDYYVDILNKTLNLFNIHLKSTQSLFSDNMYRLLLADKYMDSKYSNFIYLMLNIIDYFRVLIAAIMVYLNMRNIDSHFSDIEIGKIKFKDAMKFLTYFVKHQNVNRSIFKSQENKKQNVH